MNSGRSDGIKNAINPETHTKLNAPELPAALTIPNIANVEAIINRQYSF
jgi:hypothetical protein